VAHPSGISLNPSNLVRVMECARSGCDKIGTKSCSSCEKEFYCGSDYQKDDWNAHKIMCPLIKLMPDVLVPFKDVDSIFMKSVNLADSDS
jgi:hypothetical protein